MKPTTGLPLNATQSGERPNGPNISAVRKAVEARTGRADIISVIVALSVLCGSHTAGLLLNQVVYWSDRDTGRGEFYHSAAEWLEELGIKRDQLLGALKRLKHVGVKTRRGRIGTGAVVLFYSLDLPTLLESIKGFSDYRKKRLSEKAIIAETNPPLSENATALDSRKTRQSLKEQKLPETTTKTREASRAKAPRSARAPILPDEQFLLELQAKPVYQALNVKLLYAKMVTWCEVSGKQPTRRRLVNWLNREDQPMHAPVIKNTPASRTARAGATAAVPTYKLEPPASNNPGMLKAFIEQMRQRINEHAWVTWIRPIVGLTPMSQAVVFSVPNQIFADWIPQNYAAEIKASLEAIDLAGRHPRFESPASLSERQKTDSEEAIRSGMAHAVIEQGHAQPIGERRV